MGIPVEISLFIAFVIVAAYTYFSGLRAPALIAIVKDVLIWLVVVVAILYVPVKLGGFGHIFAAVPQQKLLLSPKQYSAYITLALGSALALFLYPHMLTGMLSSNSRRVVRRNAALLPAYMTSKRKQYTSEFKFKAVMESFQRDTTIEAVCRKFDVPSSVLSRWRQEFQQNGPGAFESKSKQQGTPAPGESPEELKKIIGELTVQNELLKKSRGLLGH